MSGKLPPRHTTLPGEAVPPFGSGEAASPLFFTVTNYYNATVKSCNRLSFIREVVLPALLLERN